MHPRTPNSRKNRSLIRWLLLGTSLGLSIILFLLLTSGESKPKTQRIVVLSTWPSNGEQVVTFRLEPATSEVAWASIVSVSDDGSTPPPTIRSPWGDLVPVSLGTLKNSTLRYDALPIRGASIAGRALAYTPGSYTVAYSPTASANRLGVGLALERVGIEDWVRRCRKCWEQKSLSLLRLKTHHDPVYVTSDPITNVFAVAR